MRERYKVPGNDEQPIHEALRHAYQAPPSPAHPAPRDRTLQPEPAPHRSYTKPKPRRWPKLALILIIIATLAGAGIYAYPKYVKANPFPADIQRQAGLSLLYPAKLPPGYQVNKASMSLANDVLIYAATNGDKRLVFTLQKMPPSFDFSTFYKQQLTGTQQFQTPYGQATVGKNSGHYLGSLPAGDTWLLLSTANPQVSIDDMSTALQNLKKY